MTRPSIQQTTKSPDAVLIVEDEGAYAQTICDVVTDSGFRAIVARNGREALAALQVERPAIMLVDLHMPVMSGSQFLNVVRRSPDWSQIPRVIMTGTNDPMIRVREDAEVLYKPIDPRVLKNVLHRYSHW